MFRVTLQPTLTPKEYDVYVADVKVDCVWTEDAIDVLEEYFSYENILFRCVDPTEQSPTMTETNIMAAVERMAYLMRFTT